MIVPRTVDDAHELLEGLMAWLAKVDDVRLLGTARAVLDLLDTTAGTADVVMLDMPPSGWDESLDRVRQLASAGYRVIVIGVVVPAGSAVARPLTLTSTAAGTARPAPRPAPLPAPRPACCTSRRRSGLSSSPMPLA